MDVGAPPRRARGCAHVHRPGAVRRLCEAPVSLRYVQCYRCEAIQCRERNIRPTYRRIVRQPWIASPHIIATYRKCGGGFAKTGRAAPCPPTGAGASLLRGRDGGCPATADVPRPTNIYKEVK
ncbi:MAG: hypothetical protein LBM98_00915 [Oscillospiraceae bacterium]|nr:hypothetical protein [Oscillospiraceae bacterium]